MNENKPLLQDVYALIAELWCSPRDVDRQEMQKNAEQTVDSLSRLDREIADLLEKCIQNTILEHEYIEMFELDPRCPLYLGSHVFDEPNTCANAAVSDRNVYMIELLGIYRHFGMVPNSKELPDYLPLVIEFLALTADSEDPIREKLIREYLLPHLPPIRARLEELNTPYCYLLDALERVLSLDLNLKQKTTEVSHV